MIICNLMGGLGNFLFQISAGYSYSLDNKIDFYVNKSFVSPLHKNLDFYAKNILRNLKFTDEKYEQIYYEPDFHYIKLPKFKDKTMIQGYFQSEKYFIENKYHLLKFFSMDSYTEEYLLNKYNEILKKNTCSIHVRRGDYLNLPNHHPTQSIEYYQKSVEIIGTDKCFLIFSDDIGWCRQNFDFIQNKHFIQNDFDYQDLYLMSMCKDNIICNSSFSWWGAWLNSNVDKKIITPKKWFGSDYSNYNTIDIYCENWIRI
jgi:hypothetical protein